MDDEAFGGLVIRHRLVLYKYQILQYFRNGVQIYIYINFVLLRREKFKMIDINRRYFWDGKKSELMLIGCLPSNWDNQHLNNINISGTHSRK